MALTGWLQSQDAKLAAAYKLVFSDPYQTLSMLTVFSESQVSVDGTVLTSMVSGPPQVIIDLLADSGNYTHNGNQSGLKLCQTITRSVHLRTDSMADSIRDELITLPPVEDPFHLRSRMQTLEEKFSLLQFQADEMDDASKNMIIRKAIKLLLKDPELTADFTFPYCDLQKQHPKNTAKLYEFVMNKGEEFQRTRKPRQTAAVAAGATRPSHITKSGGICIHNREDNNCKLPEGQCPGKHVYTGKICTNKWYTKVGLCSNWGKCHDRHPYDESKWGISRKDAVTKYAAQIREDP